ncbi:MarR family winged helix-turn-helix transcriptional regulator [Marinobacter sp. NP-6]|uniref:MarR family winged helix-turn-helix transcriptional regulator n=1 Tax=Marinobacter sp. NP-6 TaxID=2488666 RepID=UPI001C8EAB82|nr:MarR family transcriptional regulator [Marinobacter sp. NP-6]
MSEMVSKDDFEIPTASIKPGKKTAGNSKAKDHPNWEYHLGFLMHDVSRLRRTVFDNFMRPLGVTRSQWWVLAYLSRHDGMVQSDLANLLELGKAALGGLVDRLEASELIVRRPDVEDRRVKRVFLTSKGKQVVKEMAAMSHDMSERVLDGIDHEQRVQLCELLEAVKRNLVLIKSQEEG